MFIFAFCAPRSKVGSVTSVRKDTKRKEGRKRRKRWGFGGMVRIGVEGRGKKGLYPTVNKTNVNIPFR